MEGSSLAKIFTCISTIMQVKLISYEKFPTRAHFEMEALGNLEKVYATLV